MTGKGKGILLVVALAVAGGGYWFVQNQKKIKARQEAERLAGISALFDRAHLVAYGELRDLASIRKLVNLPKNKELMACLQKKGKKCRTQAKTPTAWKGPAGAHEGLFNLLGGRCDVADNAKCVVKRTTMMKIFCPNDKECASVEVMFASEYLGADKLKARRSLWAVTPEQLLSKK